MGYLADKYLKDMQDFLAKTEDLGERHRLDGVSDKSCKAGTSFDFVQNKSDTVGLLRVGHANLLPEEELLYIKNAFAITMDVFKEPYPDLHRKIAHRAAQIEEVLIELGTRGAPEQARRVSQGSFLVLAGRVSEALAIFQSLLDKDPDSKELRKLIKWAKSNGS